MRRRAVIATLVLAAGHAGPVSTQEKPPALDWIDFERLAAGEPDFRTGKAERNAVTIDVAVRIRASKEAIWNILRECEIAPEYVDSILDCRLIDSINEGRSELFVQTVKPIFFVPRFEHVFRLDYFPYDRIDVHRVSGPIAEMDGTWWLLDQEDGSILLVHSLRLHPGFPIPRIFVRATLRHDLPIVLEAVRARAEAATIE